MKIFLAVFLAFFCLTRSLGAADQKPREMLKLRLGLGSAPTPPLPNSVLWLAKDLGFYAREGLDVELNEFQGTPLAIAAMVSGDVDIANVSTSEVIRMNAAKGQPMRAIHSPDARLYFLIAARDEFKSVTALQGRTFEGCDGLEFVSRRDQKIEPRVGRMNRAHRLSLCSVHPDDFRGRHVCDVDIPGHHRCDCQGCALKFVELDIESLARIESQVFGEPEDRIRQRWSRCGTEAETKLEHFTRLLVSSAKRSG